MLKTGFDGGAWLNEPGRWEIDGGTLTVATEAETDFWRETHYGFVHDNGHAYLLPADDGFTVEARIRADYAALYDQAGLLLRLDERRWLKCGVELTDGAPFLSVVATDGRSDWSIAQPFGGLDDVRLRLTVQAGAARIQASKDGQRWPMLRLAAVPEAPRYLVGPMACSPTRAGFVAVFSDFSIGPASTEPLHAEA